METLHLNLDPSTGVDPARTPPDDRGSIFFIGNATVLIRYRGFTILTDPTFVHRHGRVSIGYGMHATRLTDPAVDISDLPPLDFVLLSHFHGDHFDSVAERDLDRGLPIVTTVQAQEELAERGFHNTTGLHTWDTLTATKGPRQLRITATPGRHGPAVVHFALPDVMGSVIEFPDPTPGGSSEPARRIYITGDTLVYDDLHEIPRRYPDLDVGLFHLGGTRVLGVLVTMDAEQGVEALRLIGPKTAIPIHYDDYDVFTSPLEDFLAAAEEAGLRDWVHPLRRGETFSFG